MLQLVMEATLNKILDDALCLPISLRACLAERLLESLDMKDDAVLSPAWRDEIARRVKEVEAEIVALAPAEHLFYGCVQGPGMKSVQFHPDATAEMNAAAAWYEEQQRSLGKRFLAVVQATLQRMQINPHLYPEVSSGLRRGLLHTFLLALYIRLEPMLFRHKQ